MAGGRPTQPDSLKALKGTLQPSRVNKDAPVTQPGMPQIPIGLNFFEKKKFISLAQELSQMKIITPHDQYILELIAKEFGMLKVYEKQLKKDGFFYHGEKVEKQEDSEGAVKVKTTIISTRFKAHPALSARNQAWTNIMKGLQECGLTPSTRSKVKVVKEEDSNPFSKFLLGS
jgi:P27 family predicted phage terminase small subunit